jgi:hypothetical protein
MFPLPAARGGGSSTRPADLAAAPSRSGGDQSSADCINNTSRSDLRRDWSAGQPLGTEHAGPFVERRVRGDQENHVGASYEGPIWCATSFEAAGESAAVRCTAGVNPPGGSFLQARMDPPARSSHGGVAYWALLGLSAMFELSPQWALKRTSPATSRPSQELATSLAVGAAASAVGETRCIIRS